MKKSRSIGLVAALLGVLLAGGGAQAAQASTSTSCPTGRVCFYFNSNYQGARADLAYSDASLAQELFTDGPSGRNGWGVVVGNNAASVINKTGKRVLLFDSRGCDGRAGVVLYPGERVNLSDYGLRNKVSSLLLAHPEPWMGEDYSWCVVRDQSRF